MDTFFWHDYETWGANPKVDRAAQFAGIRTDLNLNIIGEPLVLFCKPPPDLLPHPEACLITGITPQYAEANGVLEYEFVAAIHQELSKPGTCGVGYNTIRFDDEVTRHLLYRNFYDAYEREWQNNNSRWDIIDLVRTCYALRPEGIEWPTNAEGKPSFKLEHLTAANNLTHKTSHDALSDVYATIELAKLIKQKQPKLFDYLYKLRSKHEVSKLIDVTNKKPILHISGMLPTQHGCAALMMPLAIHPKNKNEIICYNLSIDPTPLIELDVEEIRKRVFSSTDSLTEKRISLKNIRINHCPVVCEEKLLDVKTAERLHINHEICKQHHAILLSSNLSTKLNELYNHQDQLKIIDPEQMLYSGGFFNSHDKNSIKQVRLSSKTELAKKQFHFNDDRLPELLLRFRARNFPETLTSEEQQQWSEFCYSRLTDPQAGVSIVMDNYKKELARLETEHFDNEKHLIILVHLREYLNALLKFTNK